MRTKRFKDWFGDWESVAEIKSFSDRIARWMTPENIKKAKGKTREQIFSEFGNDLEPIAYIPEGYLRYLDSGIKDNRVYSGMGYMLDHAVNHHPEVDLAEYQGIQSVIDTADDVKLDDRNKGRNKSILFIKQVGKSGVVIVSFDEGENGKIVLHKSFFDKMKAGRFDKLPSIKLSSEVGNPSISHASEEAPAVRLSALEDSGIKPNIIRPVNGVSKVVDENGEPLVVYHGTNNDKTTEIWDERTKCYDVRHEKFWTFRGGQHYFNSSEDNAGGYGNEIYAVYLRMVKPLVIDCNGSDYDTIPYNGKRYGSYEIGELAKRKGFDGVILKNIRDGVDFGSLQTQTTDYIVFEPTQIKSATDNIGTFDPANPDIRFSISNLYTGSAADYEKPSLLKVGTGEGSQVYGWGLYGSDVRGVAENYIPPNDKIERSNQYRENLKRRIAEETDPYEKENLEYQLKQAEKARPVQAVYEQTFFTNRAPGDESHLLKWYEPVSEEQKKWILAEAEKEGFATRPSKGFGNQLLALKFDLDHFEKAEDLYEGLSLGGRLGSPKAASEFLARADIDGIKYPVDSYGKTVKDGDKAGWNYVSFRDDNIRVDHKWVDGQQRWSVAASPTLREDVEAALLKRDDAHPDAIQKGRHEEIVFSENIPVFEFLGLPNLRVVTEVSKIRKFAIKHHLSVDQIVDIPNGYDNPVAIMSDDDGYVLLTDRQVTTDDGEEKPMRLFLRPTKWRSGEIVLLATAMAENGKDELEYYEPRIKSGLMFADENRIAGLNLGEETESILRIQASGENVKTAADFSAWRSTPRSISNPAADGNTVAAIGGRDIAIAETEPLTTKEAQDESKVRAILNSIVGNEYRQRGEDRLVKVGAKFPDEFWGSNTSQKLRDKVDKLWRAKVSSVPIMKDILSTTELGPKEAAEHLNAKFKDRADFYRCSTEFGIKRWDGVAVYKCDLLILEMRDTGSRYVYDIVRINKPTLTAKSSLDGDLVQRLYGRANLTGESATPRSISNPAAEGNTVAAIANAKTSREVGLADSCHKVSFATLLQLSAALAAILGSRSALRRALPSSCRSSSDGR